MRWNGADNSTRVEISLQMKLSLSNMQIEHFEPANHKIVFTIINYDMLYSPHGQCFVL